MHSQTSMDDFLAMLASQEKQEATSSHSNILQLGIHNLICFPVHLASLITIGGLDAVIVIYGALCCKIFPN